MKFKFEMRDLLKDQITGFQGAVISRTENLSGNVYGIQPIDLNNGMPQETRYFDEARLTPVKEERAH